MIASLISLLGSVGGPLASWGSSALSSRKQFKRQWRLQQQQQRWLEKMSSTAHQREVTDLRAAGLNPILSAGGSGSSTPSGGLNSVQSDGGADFSGLSEIADTVVNEQNAKTAARAQVSQSKVNESQVELNQANAQLANAKTAKELNIGKPIEKAGQLFDALSDPNTYKGGWSKFKEFFGGSSSAKSSGDKSQKFQNVFKDGKPYPYPEKTRGNRIDILHNGTSYGEYYYQGKWHKGMFYTPHK